MIPEYCSTCKWYAEFEGVCCNGNSEHCADFRRLDDTCEKWEEVEEMKNSSRAHSVDTVLPKKMCTNQARTGAQHLWTQTVVVILLAFIVSVVWSFVLAHIIGINL